MVTKRPFPIFTAAAVFVVGVIMLVTMGRVVVFLAVALIVAFAVSLGAPEAEPRRVLRAYALSVGAQVLHLVEEYRAGFYRAFPPVLGAPAWRPAVFMACNVNWLLVFGIGWCSAARCARILLNLLVV